MSLIYMVEHTIALPHIEEEWSEWVTSYLRSLLEVPGIRTIQRFKVQGSKPARYLSMHNLASADVFESVPYKSRGGGGNASARFRPAYQSWTRNLFDAALPAPAVQSSEVLFVLDASSPRGPQYDWMPAVGLHMSTPFRGLAIAPANAVAASGKAELCAATLYTPLSPQWKSNWT